MNRVSIILFNGLRILGFIENKSIREENESSSDDEVDEEGAEDVESDYEKHCMLMEEYFKKAGGTMNAMHPHKTVSAKGFGTYECGRVH